MCYAYWSLLVKYVPQSLQNFSIDFDFPNIDDKLVNQKDNAIIIAEMTIVFSGQELDVERFLLEGMGNQYNNFASECSLLQ